MEVAILVGLPASGKTTFFRERLAATHAHVSKDLMPNVRARGERQRQEIERALAAGRSVAVDNTNPRRSDRAPILAQARAHGARTVGYYFATTPRDCLARNAGREGRARVPPVAVFLAARRMERPARDEGFDALYEVRPIAPAGFDLRPLDTSSGDEEPPPAARSVYPRKVAPESWLSGPVEGVSPYLMPAAHALLQAREDLARAAEGLTADQLWARPGGAASVGFHLKHVAGSLDRLLTYARGEALTDEQRNAAAREADAGPETESAALVALASLAIDAALDQIRGTDPRSLLLPRAVGRARLPSTVLGLIFHAAEHAQRHTGQAIATAKAIRGR